MSPGEPVGVSVADRHGHGHVLMYGHLRVSYIKADKLYHITIAFEHEGTCLYQQDQQGKNPCSCQNPEQVEHRG